MRLSPEFAEIRNRVWRAVYHQKPNIQPQEGKETAHAH
jgi:NitT/TauT family transport system ATP-binding protein